MGIEYSAAIIVGLPREDLREHEQYEEFCDGVLDQAPPHYDGGSDAIMGVIVKDSGDYCASEMTGSVDALIAAAKDQFKEATGLDGKVYLTPIGW